MIVLETQNFRNWRSCREKGYLSGFYGKWHLGSLSDRGVGSPDCYPMPTSGKENGTCQVRIIM
jgi:hypothetical protein